MVICFYYGCLLRKAVELLTALTFLANGAKLLYQLHYFKGICMFLLYLPDLIKPVKYVAFHCTQLKANIVLRQP